MNRVPIPNADPIIHCHECKHLEVVNSKEVYANCKKTGYVFKPFQTDTRQHFCAFGESAHETNTTSTTS